MMQQSENPLAAVPTVDVPDRLFQNEEVQIDYIIEVCEKWDLDAQTLSEEALRFIIENEVLRLRVLGMGDVLVNSRAIGSGGSGFVFRGFSLSEGKIVALKIPSAAAETLEHAQRKNLTEALVLLYLAGELNQANQLGRLVEAYGVDPVLRVYDRNTETFDERELPVLVMVYLGAQYESLESYLQVVGPLSPPDILSLFDKIAEAASVFDEEREIPDTTTSYEELKLEVIDMLRGERQFPVLRDSFPHGDLSGENIRVEGSGGPAETVVIIDIGESPAVEKGHRNQTLRIAAPEVILNSQERSLRSDVFALGTLLFKSMTGIEFFELSEEKKEAIRAEARISLRDKYGSETSDVSDVATADTMTEDEYDQLMDDYDEDLNPLSLQQKYDLKMARERVNFRSFSDLEADDKRKIALREWIENNLSDDRDADALFRKLESYFDRLLRDTPDERFASIPQAITKLREIFKEYGMDEW